MEMYYKPVEAADVVHFGLVVFFSTTTRTFDALAHYHIRFPFIYSSAYSSCNINEANMIRLLVLRVRIYAIVNTLELAFVITRFY